MEATSRLRWGFLAPWCSVLKNRISYERLYLEEKAWDAPQRHLLVRLPQRKKSPFEQEDEATFRLKFRKSREALSLLAAVGHVDQSAFKFLLRQFCGVDLGKEGEEIYIPVRYLLILDIMENKGLEEDEVLQSKNFDLAQFCGTAQRENSSSEYRSAMAMISVLDPSVKSDKLGVDIKIPVRVYWIPYDVYMATELMMIKNIRRAEMITYEEWADYSDSDDAAGSLRCTFVLEPLIAFLGDRGVTDEMADAVGFMVRNNMRCSQLSLLANVDRTMVHGQIAIRAALGEAMGAIFDSARRPPENTYTSHFLETQSADEDSRPLQLGSINILCTSGMQAHEFEAVCSAMAVAQTTKSVSLRLENFPSQNMPSTHWWKWVAYAFFSKRARACSTVETLTLTSIVLMDTEDIEGFVSVLTSDHPEQELFGTPPGQVEDRDVVLKSGAAVRWEFDNRGEPREVSLPLVFETPVYSVRTFSDDGESEWVNALVPGFGRCHVRRTDLDLESPMSVTANSCAITSLTVGFHGAMFTDSTGLEAFLSAIGSDLVSLSLESPERCDISTVLRRCPNLQKLAIRNGIIDIWLDFHDYRPSHESITCEWSDVVVLSR